MGLKLEAPQEYPVATPKSLLEFYQCRQAKLLNFARKNLPLGLRSAAVDALQTAYLKVLNRIRNGAQITNLSTYFYSAIRNEAIAIIRKQKNIPSPTTDLAEIIPDPHAPADIRLAFQQQCEIAIASVNDNERAALALASQGYTGQEISEALDQKLNTAKTILHRARRRAKSALNQTESTE